MAGNLLKFCHNPFKVHRYFRLDRLFVSKISALECSGAEIHFMDIGANDGGMFNPLSDYLQSNQWRGVMVEPQSKPFAVLVDRYRKNSGISFENCAIANTNSKKRFYPQRINFKSSLRPPEWFKGRWKGLNFISMWLFESPLDPVDVDCMTVDSLLEKHNLRVLDVLVCDTEGYDLEILKMVDFDRFQPKLILIEVLHLRPPELAEAQELLARHHYEYYTDGWDLVAYPAAIS